MVIQQLRIILSKWFPNLFKSKINKTKQKEVPKEKVTETWFDSLTFPSPTPNNGSTYKFPPPIAKNYFDNYGNKIEQGDLIEVDNQYFIATLALLNNLHRFKGVTIGKVEKIDLNYYIELEENKNNINTQSIPF